MRLWEPCRLTGGGIGEVTVGLGFETSLMCKGIQVSASVQKKDARMNAEGCVSRGGSVLENSVGAKREGKFRGCRLAGSSEG